MAEENSVEQVARIPRSAIEETDRSTTKEAVIGYKYTKFKCMEFFSCCDSIKQCIQPSKLIFFNWWPKDFKAPKQINSFYFHQSKKVNKEIAMNTFCFIIGQDL